MKKNLLRTFVILLFVIITAASIHNPSKFPFRSPVTNKFFSYKRYLKIFRPGVHSLGMMIPLKKH